MFPLLYVYIYIDILCSRPFYVYMCVHRACSWDVFRLLYTVEWYRILYYTVSMKNDEFSMKFNCVFDVCRLLTIYLAWLKWTEGREYRVFLRIWFMRIKRESHITNVYLYKRCVLNTSTAAWHNIFSRFEKHFEYEIIIWFGLCVVSCSKTVGPISQRHLRNLNNRQLCTMGLIGSVEWMRPIVFVLLGMLYFRGLRSPWWIRFRL